MNPTEHVPESLQGVVLAGGDSTRFGARDKALARIDSQPLINRIVNVLSQVTHREPVIAVRTREQQTTYSSVIDRTDIRFVFDTPAYEGPLAGIIGAATALDSRWLFCCGCDMPLLASTAVGWLIGQHSCDRTNSPQEVDAVAVEHPNGTIEPLHAVYRRESVLGAKNRLHRTAGPRQLLSQLETVHTVSTAAVPEHVRLATSLTNVNTREELEAVRTRMRSV